MNGISFVYFFTSEIQLFSQLNWFCFQCGTLYKTSSFTKKKVQIPSWESNKTNKIRHDDGRRQICRTVHYQIIHNRDISSENEEKTKVMPILRINRFVLKPIIFSLLVSYFSFWVLFVNKLKGIGRNLCLLNQSKKHDALIDFLTFWHKKSL